MYSENKPKRTVKMKKLLAACTLSLSLSACTSAEIVDMLNAFNEGLNGTYSNSQYTRRQNTVSEDDARCVAANVAHLTYTDAFIDRTDKLQSSAARRREMENYCTEVARPSSPLHQIATYCSKDHTKEMLDSKREIFQSFRTGDNRWNIRTRPGFCQDLKLTY